MEGASAGVSEPSAARCKLVPFFLHPSHSPPPTVCSPQSQVLCSIGRCSGVSTATGAAATGATARVLTSCPQSRDTPRPQFEFPGLPDGNPASVRSRPRGGAAPRRQQTVPGIVHLLSDGR